MGGFPQKGWGGDSSRFEFKRDWPLLKYESSTSASGHPDYRTLERQVQIGGEPRYKLLVLRERLGDISPFSLEDLALAIIRTDLPVPVLEDCLDNIRNHPREYGELGSSLCYTCNTRKKRAKAVAAMGGYLKPVLRRHGLRFSSSLRHALETHFDFRHESRKR